MSGGVFSLLAFWLGGAGSVPSVPTQPAFAATLTISDVPSGALTIEDAASGTLGIVDVNSATLEVT